MCTPLGVFIMIASLEVLGTKAEDVPSPHEVGPAMNDNKLLFLSLRDNYE